MYLSVELLEDPKYTELLKEKGHLEIIGQQILGFKNLEKLVDLTSLIRIDMSQNYIRMLENIFY